MEYILINKMMLNLFYVTENPYGPYFCFYFHFLKFVIKKFCFTSLMSNDLNYSSNLEKAISEILPSKNPLDNPDFNAIDYINGVLPDGLYF